MAHPQLRKLITFDEETLIEGFKPATTPLRMIAVAAVIKNPWSGRFVKNLQPEIQKIGPKLGELLTARIIACAGSGDSIQAYGKSAVVGLNGEIEHASGVIHTLRFGNYYREAVTAKSYLSFTNTRGPANAPIQIPLMDKNDAGKRSHYMTIHFSIPDAPTPDEIIVCLGCALGGRPHHRIGDRYQDIKLMGGNIKNPASV